jgi:hypothetical protein
MNWLFLLVLAVTLLFGFVILFGAPYLPTLNKQRQLALELLDLKPGQTLVELGSGDGRMLAAAARQGIRSIGYELNPLLVIYSKATLWRYRKLVDVKLGNFWTQRLPECDGIYVFLLDRYMTKLYKKITQEITSPVKLVSFAFKVPKQKTVTERNGMFLYQIVPPKTRQ